MTESKTNEAVSQKEIADFMTGMKADIEAAAPEGVTDDAYRKQFSAQASDPRMQYFLLYDPSPALEKELTRMFCVVHAVA